MASSAAQIHVLGGIGIVTSSSSSKRNLNVKESYMPRSAFFGSRNGPFTTPTSAFLKMSIGNGSVVPVRVAKEKVVGIDLGTTNSAVAVMEGGKPMIVTNSEGQRTTPSVVAYAKSGDRLVGQVAKRQAVVNPENTFSSVKRFIGRTMNEVDEESKQVSYRVVEDENGNVKLECPAIGKQYAAEEISAQVLRKLVDDASRLLNHKVTKAVITVPAYFNNSERAATKDAGRVAGLDVLRIINEPTAASLAYAFERKSNETILVFDLGGGTFDVSVVALGAAVQAGVLAGDVSDIVLLDVTPLSIGLKNVLEMDKFIPRNSTLPTSKSMVYTTGSDGQTSIRFYVLQGERQFARDNKCLGSFLLDGIPPAPRGVPNIDVKIDIDANGILSATATDRATGNKQEITITGATTLPKDEAERFAKDDKQKREAVDTKKQKEKQLEVFGEKIPGEMKEKIEAKLQELKDKIESGSSQEIKDSVAALNQEVMQIGLFMYNQPGAGAGAAGPSPPGGEGSSSEDSSSSKGGDDVIDPDLTDSK
uniref:Uncharacterized protein n=1 Tax=Brassica campestris TaxID=3711 RepID=M4DBC8_BRACM